MLTALSSRAEDDEKLYQNISGSREKHEIYERAEVSRKTELCVNLLSQTPETGGAGESLVK